MAEGYEDCDLTPAQREAYQVFAGMLALTRLPTAAVSRMGGAVGWKTTLGRDHAGRQRELWFILGADFPMRVPEVYVRPPAYQVWPHAMRGGQLCLWVDGQEPVGQTAAAQAKLALQNIGRVLSAVFSPNREAMTHEFQREWLAYWTPAVGKGHVAAGHGLLLGHDHDKPALIRASSVRFQTIKERVYVLLGGSEQLHDAWVSTFTTDRKRIVDGTGLFVPLAEPPIGAPPNLQALTTLLSTACPDALPLLRELLATTDGPTFVVLRAGHPAAFVALQITRIPDPQPPRGYDGRRSCRGKKVRRAAGLRVSALALERADPDWIHGRGFDLEAKALRTKHVVLVGCGSLGGLVARALVAAGVGTLTLVDKDRLAAPNLGRHVLGARHLGQSKAKCLAEEIKAQFPHAKVIPHHKPYNSFSIPTGVDPPALIISTTAAWPVERVLIQQLQRGRLPALQLAWSEAHALAGHAVLALGPEDDLLALYAANGNFQHDVGEPTAPLLLPGCDGTHQPGTFNRMQRIAALAVEQAVSFLTGVTASAQRRTWIGDQRSFEQLGVHLREEAKPPLGICECTVQYPIPKRR